MKLPLNCEAFYFEDFLAEKESARIYKAVSETCDLSDHVISMADGREITLPCGKFAFADESIAASPLAEPAGPRHSWIPEVQALKEKVEAAAKRAYNVCVGYYYKDGAVGFDYHHDVPAFDDLSTQACVSLGQERVFSFRHFENHDDSCDVTLAEGSLLLMGQHCRERYEHALFVDPEAKDARMVLLFQNHFTIGSH